MKYLCLAKNQLTAEPAKIPGYPVNPSFQVKKTCFIACSWLFYPIFFLVILAFIGFFAEVFALFPRAHQIFMESTH